MAGDVVRDDEGDEFARCRPSTAASLSQSNDLHRRKLRKVRSSGLAWQSLVGTPPDDCGGDARDDVIEIGTPIGGRVEWEVIMSNSSSSSLPFT
mmetsp:Transcript_64864/g.105036  ORF Transcript_64864/g.105036 Transcript_64864/m.105036 type:complete len:94 (-) Transcript_64864:1135-1416(-)